MVRPRKLVAPVSDKVQYTHQAKKSTHTHRPTAKANIAKAPGKQKAIKKKNSKLRPAQPTVTVAKRHRSEHEMRNFFIF